MLIIAVTGGIGAGKTEISTLLERQGCCRVDADAFGRQVLEPDGEAYDEVVRVFGREILDATGWIDRRRLADLAFAHPESLSRLEELTHPPIRERMRERLDRAESKGCECAVVDIPLLDRGELSDLIDLVLVVEAPAEARLRRLVSKGLEREDVARRIAAQPSASELRERADWVIDNDGDLEKLRYEVERFWDELVAPRLPSP